MKLVISIGVPLVVGFVGSLFTRPEIDGWYQTIEKPEWQPPNSVFGPVWTALYVMMGIALYLVWCSHAPADKKKNSHYSLGRATGFKFFLVFSLL